MNGVYSELIIVPVCTHVYRLSTHYTVFLISSQYPMSCLEFRFDTEWPKYELTDFIHIFVIGCKKKKKIPCFVLVQIYEIILSTIQI